MKNPNRVTLLTDQFGNKSTAEMMQDQLGLESSSAGAVDTPVEAAVWARDPESHRQFTEINKDLAMGNLIGGNYPGTIQAVRTYMMLYKLYDEMHDDPSAQFFLHKAYTMCVSSLSIGGLGLKSINVQGMEIEFKGSPQTPQKQGNSWFRFGKR